MTTLALGHRTLAAHPSPYHGATCASVHVRRHVHDQSGEVLFPMPDGCAACGRQWFAEDEITYMGYCGDCWPGNAMLLDVTDGVEAVPATYPQPVRHRAPEPAQGRASVPECMACVAMQIKYNQPTAECATHRKPSYPDVGAMFDRWAEQAEHGNPFAPFGPRSER